MQVQPLGQGDPLEEGMATHARILAWRIPWTEYPWTVHRVAELDTTEAAQHACVHRNRKQISSGPGSKGRGWSKGGDSQQAQGSFLA